MKRLGVAIAALALSFGAAVFILVGIDLADIDTCRELSRSGGIGECWDGRELTRLVAVALSLGAGALLAASVIPALAYVVKERWLKPFAALAGGGIGLIVLYFAVALIT